MKVGLVLAENEGWWRQIIDEGGRMWTIRVRIVHVSGVALYECWVNDVLLPTYRRREPLDEQSCLESIFAVGVRYIEGRTQAT